MRAGYISASLIQRSELSSPGTPLNPSETVDKLDTLPVTVLKGVGTRVAARLERLRIRTVQDVLFHLPLRYEDWRRTARSPTRMRK